MSSALGITLAHLRALETRSTGRTAAGHDRPMRRLYLGRLGLELVDRCLFGSNKHLVGIL